MWGRVNTAAILFLLFVLTAIVLTAVSQTSPKWATGEVGFDVAYEVTDGTHQMYANKRRQMLKAMEQCDEECKTGWECDDCSPCCKLIHALRRLEVFKNRGPDTSMASFQGTWERGLKERCETFVFESDSKKQCNKKQRLFAGDEKEMSSSIKSISDMLTVGLVLEVSAFVARVFAIIFYSKFHAFSHAFRAYVLLPVADVLLKFLSLFLFWESVDPTEEPAFGFMLYAVASGCAVLSLLTAIWDQFTGVRDSDDPRYVADCKPGDPNSKDMTEMAEAGPSSRYPYPVLHPQDPPPRYESPTTTPSFGQAIPRNSPPMHHSPHVQRRILDPERQGGGSSRQLDHMVAGDSSSLPRSEPRSRSQRSHKSSRERNRSADSTAGIVTPNSGHRLGAPVQISQNAMPQPTADEVRKKRCDILGGSNERIWGGEEEGVREEAVRRERRKMSQQ